MKLGSKNSGFTLIEMMLVLAIVVLLVSMIVGIAKRVDDQGKERLCRDTIALIGNALEQFRDFGYVYKNPNFAGLTFPLDCNGFIEASLVIDFNAELGTGTCPALICSPPAHNQQNSGSEALYLFLSQVPNCRKTIDKIDKSLIASTGTINIDCIDRPLTRFIDPWGTALRYRYYEVDGGMVPIPATKKTFPVITSAGPDKTFDTSDDISNIQKK